MSCFMSGMHSSKTLHKSKTRKLNTKFPFKTQHFLGVRGLTISSFTVYDYTTSGHTDTYSMYLVCLFIYFEYNKNVRLTSTVFDTVNYDRTVVILLHRHFSSWLRTFCKSISIMMKCMYTNTSMPKITSYVKNSFIFFRSAYYI
jgi:hypothetical protein